MKYRAEIDGLRAFAVIPVILFHAGFESFSGGFIGVDVFFVISGYLITTILINDLEDKKFSFFNFYSRRARRILPALFFVMIVCIPLAWFWMLPGQMKDFSQSLFAVSLFISNFLFAIESGYFDLISEEKPLLHTWSLAIEEQYYLIFPIYLFLFWKFGKNKIFWTIVIITTISFLFCEIVNQNKISMNFFLTPSRVWEILAGSIVAFMIKKNGIKKNNFLSISGLTAIFFSIFFFNRSTPFPSAYTLIPVIGTVFIILYTSNNSLVGKILNNKFLVSLGLISYSAYLWHQPIFAFTRIRLTDELSSFLMTLLVIISLLLSYITWRWIEKPFRKNKKLYGSNYFIIGIITFFIIFVSFGYLGHKSNGFDHRLAAKHLPMDFYKSLSYDAINTLCIDKSEPCNLYTNIDNSKKVLLVGDSHSVNFHYQFIDDSINRNITSYQFSTTGCGFFLTSSSKCKSKIKKLKEIVKKTKFNEIIFVNNLYSHAAKRSKNDWNYYESLMNILAKNTEKLYVFLPRHSIQSSSPVKNIIHKNEALNGIKLHGKEQLVDNFYKILNKKYQNFFIFNQSQILLNLGGGLNSYTALTNDGYPIYTDTNHITMYAADYVYKNFIEFRLSTNFLK